MTKVLEIVETSNVGPGGTSDKLTAAVTTGKRAIVKYFGAAIPGNGVVDLYFGDDFIRSVANGTYEFTNMNEDFIGDGTKKFKVTRTQTGGGGPMAIKTWFRAIEMS